MCGSSPTPFLLRCKMLPKRVIKVESKIYTGDTLGNSTTSCKKWLDCVGQVCLQCGDKCLGGYKPHIWRKQCITCGCTLASHQVLNLHEALPYFKNMTIKDDTTTADKRRLDMKYAWYPLGLNYDMVEKYMLCLPKDYVPLKDSKLEQMRWQRFYYQHPLHDSNNEFCYDLSELEKKRMVAFIERKLKSSFGVGKVSVMINKEDKICLGCSKPICQESLFVAADEGIGQDKIWHPQCFRCSDCMELLTDLLYFYSSKNDKIYCGRHYGETFVPRCNGCDELIFTGTYTEAKGKCWHKKHFICVMCDKELHGKKYKEKNELIYCGECYDKFAAVECQKCKKPIGIGSKKFITIENDTWHLECFVCKRCKEKLVGQPYNIIDKDLFCRECLSNQAIAQCEGCKLAINPTVSFLRHKKRCWHANCFNCSICQTWLANGEFHEMDDNIMCKDCFVSKVSKKCTMCQLPATKCIQFGLNVYHAECFKCSDCYCKLIGKNNIKNDKDGKLLCQDCDLKLAKKCFHCKGPITKRYTLYKSRAFHLECFKCNICGSIINNKEFFETSLCEVLCSSCVHK